MFFFYFIRFPPPTFPKCKKYFISYDYCYDSVTALIGRALQLNCLRHVVLKYRPGAYLGFFQGACEMLNSKIVYDYYYKPNMFHY